MCMKVHSFTAFLGGKRIPNGLSVLHMRKLLNPNVLLFLYEQDTDLSSLNSLSLNRYNRENMSGIPPQFKLKPSTLLGYFS